MHLRHPPSRAVALVTLLAAIAGSAFGTRAAAQRAGALVEAARADFADRAAGDYAGEAGRRVAVVKTGPNRVRLVFADPPQPALTVQLVRAGDVLRGGDSVRIDLARRPLRLTVTVGGVSWSGVKQ